MGVDEGSLQVIDIEVTMENRPKVCITLQCILTSMIGKRLEGYWWWYMLGFMGVRNSTK